MYKLKLIFLTLITTILFVNVQAQVDISSSYSPPDYGLPNTLAGYKVMAVKTSENTACMSTGTKRIILQASDPDVETFLKNSRPPLFVEN